MAKKQLGSLRLGKAPKAPKMNASTATWDKYEKRKKEYVTKAKLVESEKARRQKIKSL